MRTILALLLLASPCMAQEVSLAWKFSTGDAFLIERIGKGEQVMLLREQTFKQDVRSTFIYRVDVTKADKESAKLQVMFENVAVRNLGGGGDIESKILERAKGAMLTFEITPRGKITNLEGYEALIEQMAEKKKELGKVARQLWPESLIRYEFEELFPLLPEGKVKPLQSWKTESVLPMPPLGTFALSQTTMFQEFDRAGNLRLAGSMKGTYQPPAQPSEWFRVIKGDMNLFKGAWASTFDSTRGRALFSQRDFEIRGTVTVEVMGQQTSAEVQFKYESTTKLLPRAAKD